MVYDFQSYNILKFGNLAFVVMPNAAYSHVTRWLTTRAVCLLYFSIFCMRRCVLIKIKIGLGFILLDYVLFVIFYNIINSILIFHDNIQYEFIILLIIYFGLIYNVTKNCNLYFLRSQRGDKIMEYSFIYFNTMKCSLTYLFNSFCVCEFRSIRFIHTLLNP